MNHADDLRDDAREWDISECPERAARARAAAAYIQQLEADMDQITGFLAGVETLYTTSEVLARIDLLPSVQAAFERNLSDNNYQGE